MADALFPAPLNEVKAELFKSLGHPVRIRVLELLSASPTVSVAEMLAATGLEASHLSQHLAVLRRQNLVIADRRGSQVFYTLAQPAVADLLKSARKLLVDILQANQLNLQQSVADATSRGAE
ncbi:ArsR family transcriptional regulator [Paenarthrobacter sp. DKR-5]|uniref:ArsR/SmtB family transcription factor n=1 Tax=Paenarthrobacter sp. DKR-5 TaxID=2835535 RepID=UPI001BDC7AC6|nr:metalloregulator ArsR/SmtB family transcription factor [Paenarthrobacter sp. DKR-5]MBT1001592.1 ArsR family transcriptional regulator [Paenarthrobacter sp. DKR-5]